MLDVIDLPSTEPDPCDDENNMDLHDFLVHVFKTDEDGIGLGDGDVCSIYEAVEGRTKQRWDATMERAIDEAMPRVVVALVKERNQSLIERGEYTDDKLLALAELLYELNDYPPPRAKIEAMEAILLALAH